MIEYNLLAILVTFAQENTQVQTARKLNVSQPTITRAMKKLEDEMATTLFNRTGNNITLNKTGMLAAARAKKLLQDNKQFVLDIQNYDHSLQKIKLGTVAPGPLAVVYQLNNSFNIKMDSQMLRQTINNKANDYSIEMTDHLISESHIPAELSQHRFTLIFNNQEILTDKVESLFLGNERLYVNLEQSSPLANKKALSFKELKGQSFVIYYSLGPWNKIIKKQIPNGKFLSQRNMQAVREITKNSHFPFFTTNLSQNHLVHDTELNERVLIPISDESAKIPFYASYLQSERHKLMPLLHQIQSIWPD